MSRKFAVLFLIFWLLGCLEERNVEKRRGESVGLTIKECVDIEKREVKGYLLGVNFEKGELYFEDELSGKKYHKVIIYDLTKLQPKRVLRVSAGGEEFPDKMSALFFMKYVKRRYFLVDLFTKILVYDQNFKFLYPVMFHSLRRYFLDFFEKDGSYYFFIGINNFTGKINKISGEIYKIIPNRKPKLVEKLVKFEAKDNYYKNTEKNKNIYQPVLWVTPFGFEKEGSLYYFYGEKKEYRYYKIATRKEVIIHLPYLKCKKYSKKEAEEISKFFPESNYTRWLLEHGYKFIYEPYPSPVCFFTIFDVGKGKLGLVTLVNVKEKKYRIDVIEAETGNYLESLWLPFGKVFLQATGTYHGQLPYRNFLNLDKGIYIYQDWDEELDIFTTRIIKFKLK